VRKILVIARREYLAMVGTKAFLLTLAVMPIFMLGGAVVPQLLRDQVDVTTKHVAIADASQSLYDAIAQAVDDYNKHATRDPVSGKQTTPEYRIERVQCEQVTDQLRLDLSNRIRKGELYAFVEIPASVLETPPIGQPTVVSFYAENTTLSDTKRWFDRTVSTIVQTRRLEQAGIDPAVVTQSQLISVQGRGLVERDADGTVTPAKADEGVLTILLPLGIMMFMFMVIMMSAQPMLESVLEEKGNRVAEVLLGSATPLQIMTGKLFGNVAGSLTVAVIYIAGGFALAAYNDVTDAVPFAIMPWFIVFQLLAVLMFSSLFMAIGAAVNQLKEAQSLLLPVWILIVAPMFVWFNIVREPNGGFATGISLIPPFIPMLMCLRMSCTSTVPFWQPALGVLIMVGVTSLCVLAASRVFRIGILAQGRAPKLGQLIRWALSG